MNVSTLESYRKVQSALWWRRHCERYAASHAQLKRDLAEAAERTDDHPSEAQREAGNYRKGRITLWGLPISIENPRGSVRTGVADDGTRWESVLPHHYGYIRRTLSEADGDHVDVFIGPDLKSELVFVVDQVKPSSGRFDEHKALLGFRNEADARKAYQDAYQEGWAGLERITPMTLPAFKAWLDRGDTGTRIAGQVAKYAKRDAEGHLHDEQGRFARAEGRLNAFFGENYEHFATPEKLAALHAEMGENVDEHFADMADDYAQIHVDQAAAAMAAKTGHAWHPGFADSAAYADVVTNVRDKAGDWTVTDHIDDEDQLDADEAHEYLRKALQPMAAYDPRHDLRDAYQGYLDSVHRDHIQAEPFRLRRLKERFARAFARRGWAERSARRGPAVDRYGKYQVGQTKSVNGRTYRFNENSRWERAWTPSDTEHQPSIVVSGREFGDNLSDAGAWKRVFSEASRLLRGKAFKNADTGKEIHVTRAGINKAIHHLPDTKPLKALAKLPEILEQSYLIDSVPPKDEEQNVRMFHYLGTDVLLEGKPHAVVVTVREDNNGHWFYDQRLDLIEEGSSHGQVGTHIGQTGPAGEPSPGIIDPGKPPVKKNSRSAAEFAREFYQRGWPEAYARRKPAANQTGLFDDEEHPRGMPGNAGEFRPKHSAAAGGSGGGIQMPAKAPDVAEGQRDLFTGETIKPTAVEAVRPTESPKQSPREATKGKQQAFWHGLKDAAGQGSLFGGLMDLLGGSAEKKDPPEAKPGNKNLHAAAEAIKTAGKTLPPLQSMRTHLGEDVSQDEAEEVLRHAGVNELTAADEAYELAQKGQGRIKTQSLVIAARSILGDQDREGRLADVVQQAGEAKGIEFRKEGSDVYYIVFPSPRKEETGKWQISRFDSLGPSGHQIYDTKEEAMGSAIGANPKGPYWDEGDSDYRIARKYSRSIGAMLAVEFYSRRCGPLRYRQAHEDENPKGGWITIGGGARAHVNSHGVLDAACAGLKGEDLDDLGEHEPAEHRAIREHRQDVAEHHGFEGHELTQAQVKQLETMPHPETGEVPKSKGAQSPAPPKPQQTEPIRVTIAGKPYDAKQQYGFWFVQPAGHPEAGWIMVGKESIEQIQNQAQVARAQTQQAVVKGKAKTAAREDRREARRGRMQLLTATAEDYGISPDELLSALEFVKQEQQEKIQQREPARAHARQLTGLTQRDTARLANQGLDYTSAKRIGGATGARLAAWDQYAQEIAREHPELGWGDPDNPRVDLGASLWDLIDEGRQDAATETPEMLRDAANIALAHRGDRGGAWEHEEGEPIPAGVDDSDLPEWLREDFARRRDMVERYGRWLAAKPLSHVKGT